MSQLILGRHLTRLAMGVALALGPLPAQARSPQFEPTPPANPQAYRSTEPTLPNIHYQFPLNGHPILFLPPPYTVPHPSRPSSYDTPAPSNGGGAAPITTPTPSRRGLPYWDTQPPGTPDPGPPLDAH